MSDDQWDEDFVFDDDGPIITGTGTEKVNLTINDKLPPPATPASVAAKNPPLSQMKLRGEECFDEFFRSVEEHNSVFDDDFEFHANDDIKIESIYASVDHFDYDDLPQIGAEGFDFDDESEEVGRGITRRNSNGKPGGGLPLNKSDKSPPRRIPSRQRSLELNENRFQKQNIENFVIREAEGEDDLDEESSSEDDWDAELLFDRPDYKKPEASQRALSLSGIRAKVADNLATLQYKESLLEFLESTVREKVSKRHAAPEDPQENRYYFGHSNNILDDEESKMQEISNQHLKGLSDWLKSTSKALRATIHSKNCTPKNNAKSMVDEENITHNNNIHTIEQLVDKCEEEPSKESCISAMEVVVKWIRSVCHHYVINEDGTVCTPSVPSSSGSGGGYDPLKYLSWERLDQLFARCDYILNEQSKVVVGKMLEFIASLKVEAQILRNTGGNEHLMRTHFASVGTSKGNLIPNAMHVLCQQVSLCRIQIYMLEIKSHVNTTDNLMVQLESLELIMEELETLQVWLNIISTFLPMDDDQYPSNGGIPPPPPSSPYGGMTPSKAEDDLKHIVREKVRLAKQNRAEDSLYYHDWKQSHVNIIKSILIELQASCLMSKMLLLADMSPITMQTRPNAADILNYRPSRSLFRSTTVTDRSFKKHISTTANKHEQKTKNIGDDNVYNVIYELSIGTQFVSLMFSLDSPSIMRAKLAFAACCYLHALQKDVLPWQNGMFAKIIQKKRNAEGFGALKRGESDIAFGIEADDIEFVNDDFSAYDFEQNIVETFASALGPIDEIRNLQSLLYEASVELFPTAQKLDETAFALPYPTAPLFPHVSAAMDLDQSIHEKLEHSNHLWGQPEDFTLLRKESSSAPSGASNNKLTMDGQQKGLSSLLRYELHLFSFALFSQFITSILDTSPTTGIELLEFCALILAHTNQHDAKMKYNRKALLLATKYGKTEAAIMHGRILWEHLFYQPNQVHLSEKLFVADILGEQYALQAQYELAIKTYGVTLSYLCKPEVQKALPKFSKDMELKVEKLLLALAQCYIEFGIAYQGIDILQKQLVDSTDKSDTLRNDERKIIALSYIAKGFYDLRDYESCKRTVQVIKEIRRERMHKVVGKLTAMEKTHSSSPVDDKASNASNASNYSLSDILLNVSNEKADQGWESSAVASSTRSNASLASRYLLNNEYAMLPKFAITAHNIDLGLIQARIYHKSGMYVSALKSIAPVIASVEVAIGGRSGNREGMLELGGLYYLRGEIQLDACRSSSTLKYPFEIGSSHLFSAIHVLATGLQNAGNRCKKYRTYGHRRTSRQRQNTTTDYRKSNISQVGIDNVAAHATSAGATANVRNGLMNNNQFTCRKSVNYHDASDLLWDAMKWFRRAWDIFHAAGDAINAAMSANRIAECHLLPSFVPHAYFGVPIKFALDLSNYKAGDNAKNNILSPGSVSMSNFFQEKVSPARFADTQQKSVSSGGRSLQSFSASQQYIDVNFGVQKRYASLEEVDKASSFALDIHLDSSLPFELMHSYMNLAESNYLQGNPSGALPFWWETKDLFLHFFCDGCLIPLIRRSNLHFIERVDHILDRIVRFMWKCDPTVRNNHLSLLEIHNTVKIEYNRMIRMNGMHARELIPELQKLFRVLLKKGGSSSPAKLKLQSSFNSTTPHSPLEKNDSNTSSVSETSEKVTAMQNKANAGLWHALKKAFGCGASTSSIKKSTTTNPMGKESGNVPAKVASTLPVNPLLGLVIRGYLDSVKLQYQQSDRRFFTWINEHTVAEKAMDFGWHKFIDYDALVPSTYSMAPMSVGRNKVQSVNLPSSLHKSVLTGGVVGNSGVANNANNNATDFALDKAVSSKYFSVEDDPHKTPQDVMEYYCKRYWLAKYGKLPSFLISHVFCERDLMSPDDMDSDSDSDDELSSNPSSSYTGNSRHHGQNSSSSPYVAEDASSSNHNSFTIGDLNRPLDPNADFEWMNDMYTMYYTPSLISTYMEDQDIEASPLLLPELKDIDLFGGIAGHHLDGRHAKIEAGKQLIQSHHFHRSLEIRSETILIQRIWNLFLRTENHCKLYRKHHFTVNRLSLLVRQSLSQVSMNMLRLRTFSRQYKGSLYCYDNLLSVLNNNSEFNREPRSPMTTSDFNRQVDRMKVTRLQDRLPQMVYMHYIENVLFAYQPHTGNEHVQMLGSDCCVKFSQAMSMYVEREQGGAGGNKMMSHDMDAILEDGAASHGSNSTHSSSYTTESTAATYPEDTAHHMTTPMMDIEHHTNASTFIPPLNPRVMKSRVNGIAIEPEPEPVDQFQREVKIGPKETMLIFDYCVKEKDQECGGGFNNRSRSLVTMKRGALFSCLQFFTDVMQTEQPMSNMIAYDDTGMSKTLMKSSSFFALHGSSSSGEIVVDEKNLFNHSHLSSPPMPTKTNNAGSNTDMSSLSGSSTASTMSQAKMLLNRSSFNIPPAQDSGNFSDSSGNLADVGKQGNRGHHLPPHHPVPITLICSHPANTIPWEALMMETRIVRSFSLSSMLAQIFDTVVPNQDDDFNFDWLRVSPPKLPIPTENFIVNRPSRSPSHDGLRGAAMSPPKLGTTTSAAVSKATVNGFNASLTNIKGYLGPASNQKPLFVAVAWDVNGFTARQFNDIVKQSQHRRARAAIQVLDALDHNCNHILRDERNQELLRSFDRPKSMAREEKVSPAIQEKYNHQMWMLRTMHFPLNTLTSDKLPSTIFDSSSFYGLTLAQVPKQSSLKDAWNGLDQKLNDLGSVPLTTSSASHKKTTPTNRGHVAASNNEVSLPSNAATEGLQYFPILLLSYVDLIELTEALIYFHCCHKRDAVLIFAPQFIQDKLSIELKIALDRWCRVEATPHNSLYSNSTDSNQDPHGINVMPNTTTRTLQTYGRSGSFHISSVDSESTKASIPVFHNFGKNPSASTLHFTASKDTLSELASESNSEPDLFPFLKTSSIDTNDHITPPTSSTSGTTGLVSRTHSGTMSLPRTGSRSSALLPPSSGPPPQERKSITNLALDVKTTGQIPHTTLRAKERTSAYHVVMDVVQRMQREHAVSITVII